MSENNKNTHKGRAAEYFAMSQLLLRGWNVSIPVVDVGDDVLIIDDRNKITHRVQVRSKTAERANEQQCKPFVQHGRSPQSVYTADFGLSRSQLRQDPPASKLFYFLLARIEGFTTWSYFIISRERLAEVKAELEAPMKGKRLGRPRIPDEKAPDDSNWSLKITYDDNYAFTGDTNLSEYLNKWPEDLPIIQDGPGSRTATELAVESPRPSQHPGK